jgi:hypothetical protein
VLRVAAEATQHDDVRIHPDECAVMKDEGAEQRGLPLARRPFPQVLHGPVGVEVPERLQLVFLQHEWLEGVRQLQLEAEPLEVVERGLLERTLRLPRVLPCRRRNSGLAVSGHAMGLVVRRRDRTAPGTCAREATRMLAS